MRPEKGEKRPEAQMQQLQVDVEVPIVEHLQAMEKHTNISRSELVTIALKRFIVTHKDYFPAGYKVS